jgi:DNA polymerase-3 subunit delta'
VTAETAPFLPEPPEALALATRHQPRACATLTAALANPSHAFLFRGPRGAGKRTAARAFAAEILAQGAPDPDESRRRAMLDPSPHPDLVWLRPPGAQHLVDEVRESVIRAASLRPAEGERRAFVIEEAEALRDESQNALLKTLEEPPTFAHLILICSEPELLLPTIVSRCQPVAFGPLSPEAVGEALEGDAPDVTWASRLCGGDLELARMLLSPEGRELRDRAQRAARAAFASPAGDEPPWRELLEGAEEAGREAGAAEEARLLAEAQSPRRGGAGRLTREALEQVRRTERRTRTRALDLGLALCCAWYRDIAAVASGAGQVVLNLDRRVQLEEDAQARDPRRAREAVELVLDTRRRLRVNVSEELALEALWLRLGSTLHD